jgi:hypothetical protein
MLAFDRGSEITPQEEETARHQDTRAVTKGSCGFYIISLKTTKDFWDNIT